METKNLLLGWILGTISTLAATLLQSYLTNEQSKGQTLMEVRLSMYAKLLSAVKSEERYPPDPRGEMTQMEIDTYNAKINEWRKNRKAIKGIATEVLLLTGNPDLQKKLSEFISNYNPDFIINDIENLMRSEIGIK